MTHPDYVFYCHLQRQLCLPRCMFQADGTLGVTLSTTQLRSLGGATGSQIIGLSGNTTYKVK